MARRTAKQIVSEALEADESKVRIATLERQLAQAKYKLQQAENQRKLLEQAIDSQCEFIEAKARKIFKHTVKAADKGQCWHRVIVPDSHGSQIDPAAAAAFLADVELLRPKEVVLIGDHLECGGFLAEHHTLGFVAQSAYTYAQDCAEANAFLDAIDQRTPDAEKHFIEGNHEGRVEAWCITKAHHSQVDAQFLLDQLGPRTRLHLAQRGYRYYRRSESYCGLQIRGTIRLGECLFTHGTITAKAAAAAMLARYASNVVFGHTHRIDQVVTKFADRIVTAAGVGCLSLLQPLWRHSDPTTWSQGYGVQICRPNGEFLHVTVPIINGQSLLGPLLGK